MEKFGIINERNIIREQLRKQFKKRQKLDIRKYESYETQTISKI